VAQRLDATFQNPLVDQVQKILNKRSLTADEVRLCAVHGARLGAQHGTRGCCCQQVRELLFFPTVEQMKQYPLLITPPENAPSDAPSIGKQAFVHFLSLLYLRHVRYWPLVDSFIREGGCPALVNLLSHKSASLRSQAIDIFVQVCGCRCVCFCDCVSACGA